MNHTQGEWEVEPSDCMTAHYVLRSAYDYFEEGYQSDDPQTAIALRREDKANARLIATAPDLLDACKMALEIVAGERIKNDAFPPKQELEIAFDKYVRECEGKLKQAITKTQQADEPERTG